MKRVRQNKILELIDEYDIDTQEELGKRLHESGFRVTQATISRDIKELQLKKQADKNTLQFDYDSVTQDIQDVINNKADSSITSALYNAIDALNLDEEKTTSYKAQVKDAMDTSFFPSYQDMLDTLTSLQYNVQPLQGLSNYKNGKKYYKVLVENEELFFNIINICTYFSDFCYSSFYF